MRERRPGDDRFFCGRVLTGRGAATDTTETRHGRADLLQEFLARVGNDPGRNIHRFRAFALAFHRTVAWNNINKFLVHNRSFPIRFQAGISSWIDALAGHYADTGGHRGTQRSTAAALVEAPFPRRRHFFLKLNGCEATVCPVAFFPTTLQ